MFDKIYKTIFFLLYTAIVSLSTIIVLVLVEKNNRQKQIATQYHSRQMDDIKDLSRVFRFIDDNFQADTADVALIEYAYEVMEKIEECAKFSPYHDVREEAAKLQAKFLEHFPMLATRKEKIDIREGDLIVRHNNNLHSDLFRKMNKKEQRFSHLGVVHYITPDSAILLHSVANDLTGIGGIESSTLGSFMPKGNYDIAIYRMKEPHSQLATKYVEEILRLQQKGVPFDTFFNSSDTTALY